MILIKSFVGSRGSFSKEPLAAGGKKREYRQKIYLYPGKVLFAESLFLQSFRHHSIGQTIIFIFIRVIVNSCG
jgi:hypothetical protein